MLRTHAGLRLRLVAAIVAGALTLSACAPPKGVAAAGSASASRSPGASMAASTTVAGENMVWMGEHYFSPSRLTVRVGATVTWRMLGSQEHDVWSLDGTFHSPTMGPGATYTHTFTKAGTFNYICLPHNGDGMYGEIVVQVQ